MLTRIPHFEICYLYFLASGLLNLERRADVWDLLISFSVLFENKFPECDSLDRLFGLPQWNAPEVGRQEGGLSVP